jgi:hypothetical protein
MMSESSVDAATQEIVWPLTEDTWRYMLHSVDFFDTQSVLRFIAIHKKALGHLLQPLCTWLLQLCGDPAHVLDLPRDVLSYRQLSDIKDAFVRLRCKLRVYTIDVLGTAGTSRESDPFKTAMQIIVSVATEASRNYRKWDDLHHQSLVCILKFLHFASLRIDTLYTESPLIRTYRPDKCSTEMISRGMPIKHVYRECGDTFLPLHQIPGIKTVSGMEDNAIVLRKRVMGALSHDDRIPPERSAQWRALFTSTRENEVQSIALKYAILHEDLRLHHPLPTDSYDRIVVPRETADIVITQQNWSVHKAKLINPEQKYDHVFLDDRCVYYYTRCATHTETIYAIRLLQASTRLLHEILARACDYVTPDHAVIQ